MIECKVTLIGSPTCRRYKKMRQAVQDAFMQLKLPHTLEEINDLADLSKHNPLSLPRLIINDQLAFSQNPPRSEEIIAYLRVPGDFYGSLMNCGVRCKTV